MIKGQIELKQKLIQLEDKLLDLLIHEGLVENKRFYFSKARDIPNNTIIRDCIFDVVCGTKMPYLCIPYGARHIKLENIEFMTKGIER